MSAQTEDQDRWTELAVDPFIELRLIAASAAETPPPGGIAKARELAASGAAKVLTYTLRGGPLATVVGWGLADLWLSAWSAFLRGAGLVTKAFAARRGSGEPGRAAARAATACVLLAAVADGRAVPTRVQRNGFVIALADDMGVLTEGVIDTIKSFFVNAGLKAATEAAGPHRGPFSRHNGILAGDILLYQARGAGIRAFIKSRIEESRREHATDDIYVLGHSLGGIACVDLLAQDPSLPVAGLITVGSQAPLFAEFGALVSLEPGVNKLRDGFPKWPVLDFQYTELRRLLRPKNPPKTVNPVSVAEQGTPVEPPPERKSVRKRAQFLTPAELLEIGSNELRTAGVGILQLLATRKRQTWLIGGGGSVIAISDYRVVGEPVVKWVTKVFIGTAVRVTPDDALVRIGRNRDIAYSPRLHPHPIELVRAIYRLVQRTPQGDGRPSPARKTSGRKAK